MERMNHRASRRKLVTALGAFAAALGTSGPVRARPELAQPEAAGGVRAALEAGANAAVEALGRTDGFLGNPRVRIALPRGLEQVSTAFALMGRKRDLDELVTAMNRAAEAAVPQARTLLVQAVRSMSVEDAVGLVRGSDTAVTEFFAAKTRAPLAERFLPVVAATTGRMGLARQYNALASQAAAVGLLGQDDASVERYVTARALDGMYLMIGEEERRIRRDPVGTGSAILRRVFGGS